MGEGQFNIVDFARRIGLKNIRAMPVIESIQPVSIIGDQSDLTPRFRAPAGITGGTVAAVAATKSILELQSLGIGGCIIDQIVLQSISNCVMEIGAPILTGATTSAGFPSNEAPLSVGRLGTQARAVGSAAFIRIDHVYESPIYIPKGQAFRVFTDTDNFALNAAFLFHDVPASEHGPS